MFYYYVIILYGVYIQLVTSIILYIFISKVCTYIPTNLYKLFSDFCFSLAICYTHFLIHTRTHFNEGKNELKLEYLHIILNLFTSRIFVWNRFNCSLNAILKETVLYFTLWLAPKKLLIQITWVYNYKII
jgi:hypothetical protein